MITKVMICDQCGERADFNIYFNDMDGCQQFSYPSGWTESGKYPDPPKCPTCGHQQIMFMGTGIPDRNLERNRYFKHFCSEECKAKYLVAHHEA